MYCAVIREIMQAKKLKGHLNRANTCNLIDFMLDKGVIIEKITTGVGHFVLVLPQALHGYLPVI